MRYFVIGTAGHVDHGKTTLIRALTGIDTDRLREEKERGISIELGFAYLDLSGGGRAGIVDVPGHERFVKHMLAGVGGIDLVLLVIAADEGVMPQTREHLDIIQLLGVDKGIIVLTKIDMVDEDWLGLVDEEVREYLNETALKDAPIMHVSGTTGEGLPELINRIEAMATDLPERSAVGPALLPIDRVFSVVGFGTVATGTLTSGTLRVGDSVDILPSGHHSRIRSLQVHKEKVAEVEAGHRVAVNVTGVEVDDIGRGEAMVTPGVFKASRFVDVRLFLLKTANRSLKNRARVRFHLGSAEILGRVLLLDRNELDPGEEGYAQIVLEHEGVAAKEDRFVIRSYSPMRTIGGGRVINPNPERHKRFRDEVINSLATLEMGTPLEQVEQLLGDRATKMSVSEIAEATGLGKDEAASLCRQLVEDGTAVQLRVDDIPLYFSGGRFQEWKDRVLGTLREFHRAYPLREGYPREEMRSRTLPQASPKVFSAMMNYLEGQGAVVLQPQTIALPHATDVLPGRLKQVIESVTADLKAAGIRPDSISEVMARAGAESDLYSEYLSYLTRQGILHRLTGELYLHTEAIEAAKESLEGYFRENGEITLG
ncbi:MAG: selenocysteine-specific translation elongation factor, partial [Clostridia bacterium]|nr:selenocysteine-specific translation elongation factor [Clostridia bacterium]